MGKTILTESYLCPRINKQHTSQFNSFPSSQLKEGPMWYYDLIDTTAYGTKKLSFHPIVAKAQTISEAKQKTIKSMDEDNIEGILSLHDGNGPRGPYYKEEIARQKALEEIKMLIAAEEAEKKRKREEEEKEKKMLEVEASKKVSDLELVKV